MRESCQHAQTARMVAILPGCTGWRVLCCCDRQLAGTVSLMRARSQQGRPRTLDDAPSEGVNPATAPPRSTAEEPTVDLNQISAPPRQRVSMANQEDWSTGVRGSILMPRRRQGLHDPSVREHESGRGTQVSVLAGETPVGRVLDSDDRGVSDPYSREQPVLNRPKGSLPLGIVSHRLR
jgi:hypothetical protein